VALLTSPQPTATPSADASTSAPQTRIRVQVYATVYNGRPYIINLFAADDRFSAGLTQFFNPMLQSFAFLPQGS
jgi:hypothetical protein